MNSPSWIVALLIGSNVVAGAQALLSFTETKSYIRNAERGYTFEGGALNLYLSDGSVTIAGCADNGTPLGRVFPYIFCPLGTTGFIVAGDIDGDGVRDSGTYWSVSSVEAAINVAPGENERIKIVAAPPSKLPRPLEGAGWEDTGIVIWFDVLAPPIEEYEITRYAYSRPYPENDLERMLAEIVPGTYNFEFPRLDSDILAFPIAIDHQLMIEAWPGRGAIAEATDFAALNDEDWRDETEALEVDPRLFYQFEWRGFSYSSTLSGDLTFFSMLDPFTEQVVYPPYGELVADAERFPELIDTPSSYFDLGPNFFSPGDSAIAQVAYQRNFSSTTNSTDTSNRQFRWMVDFIDSYDGFALTAFPVGSDENSWDEDTDFDDDGYTNLEEFALQTDPGDPASVPVVRPTLDALTDQYVLEIPKRDFVGMKLVHGVEYSTDRTSWTLIEPGDPNWIIEFDNETSYKVRSFQSYPDVKYFVRIHMSQL